MNVYPKFRIILPGHCQLKCLVCHNEHNPDVFQLDLPMLKRAMLDIVSTKAGYHINISGGEPFHEKNIEATMDIVSFVKCHFPKSTLSINTNGVSITPKLASWLKQNVSYVKVSLYGDSEIEYKYYTGSACWNRVISNLLFLKNHLVPVVLNCLATQHTASIDCLTNYLSLAMALGFKIKFIELICHDWFLTESLNAYETLYIAPETVRARLQSIGATTRCFLIDRLVMDYRGIQVENYVYPSSKSEISKYREVGWGRFLKADGTIGDVYMRKKRKLFSSRIINFEGRAMT